MGAPQGGSLMEQTLKNSIALTPTESRPLISNGHLGMALVIGTEIMLFSGFISSFLVARANFGTWPPLGQPRLPVAATAFNTLILLLSGLCLWFAGRSSYPETRKKLLWATLGSGAFFILFQGAEWIKLLEFGLSTTSSLYGSYFYLIVGAHALHASIGMFLLLWMILKSLDTKKNNLSVFSFYWYFVVALWPLLYALVYWA